VAADKESILGGGGNVVVTGGCGGCRLGKFCGGGGGSDGRQGIFHCVLRQYLRPTWYPILIYTA